MWAQPIGSKTSTIHQHRPNTNIPTPISNQHFETLGEEPAARGTILVKTEFVQPTDDNVKFDYRLRKTNGRWRVIDVTLDGKVSEMTLRRADYTSVIDRDGYPALVEAVQKKIDNYANE